ncbi:hypothetical protein Q31a_24540 [Aureliella helgolandensis]|uniref:Uncharacterized protein n=1 Tax=Aureliella helgolandensis TaxID=2527968 RepID=A0A518G6C7_9BACT|nr:hypothetical protein Q31a_24540 [Aureliella helgolandensis]
MGAGNTSKLRWFLSIHAIVVAPKINLQTTWLKIHSLGGLRLHGGEGVGAWQLRLRGRAGVLRIEHSKCLEDFSVGAALFP